jgi:biopolymer transport protein ExbD
MNKLKFIFLCSILSLFVSCSQIKTAVSKISGGEPKQIRPIAALTTEVKNSTIDPHITDENAVILTILSGKEYYFGEDRYPEPVISEKINGMLDKNPSERQLIYLNADSNNKYEDIVVGLDQIRQSKVENIGLLVASNGKTEPGYYVLKVKLTAEPNVENMDAESEANRKNQYLIMEKDGKIKSANFDEKELYKADKTDMNLDEAGSHLSRKIKENGNKTIHIRGHRLNRYGEIVRLVDAAVGAGATTVYLDLDDLQL